MLMALHVLLLLHLCGFFCVHLQFLEHELKQSYTTKNFTLKSGLLELEKQYR
jgi:hypothetical protein